MQAFLTRGIIGMLRENNTPFAAIGFEQWHRDGATMAVIAVRAEYIFGDDGNINLAETQDIILADEFEGDPQKTPLIKPNDLVPFKPKTDVTFLGSVYSDDHSKQQALNGSIKIGEFSTSISACGEREWVADDKSWVLSDPDPISELLLCYTKSSGGRLIGDPEGTVDPRNPIGANLIDPKFTPNGQNYPAAQIDTTEHPIHDDFSHPPLPQGFGPIAPWWQSRQRYAGTYDEDWQENIHPRLPKDFNYRFYNCAHPGLIMDGFLKGGDLVELANLSQNNNMVFRLPDVTPYAKFGFSDGREVFAALNLDGVHIDFRETPYRYSLTWRAWLDICPSFYRIDLECGSLKEVAAMGSPIVCEAGLR